MEFAAGGCGGSGDLGVGGSEAGFVGWGLVVEGWEGGKSWGVNEDEEFGCGGVVGGVEVGEDGLRCGVST